jgi:hypothetical protein
MKSFPRLLFFCLIILTFHYWLTPIYPNLGPDLKYAFTAVGKGLYLPYVWTNTLVGDGMGSYIANTLWSYPVQLIFQGFLNLSIPFWFQMKYLAFLPMLLVAMYGMGKLARHFGSNPYIAGLVYFLNSYFLIILDGGQLDLAIGYSLVPLSLYLFIAGVQKPFFYKLRFALSVWLIGSFDLRVVWLLAVIIGIYFIFDLIKGFSFPKVKQLIGSYTTFGIITASVLLLLNLYWILPGILDKPISLPQGYDQPEQIRNLSFSTLAHGLFLHQPHWYSNNFGHVSFVKWYFALIPALAFIPLLLRPTRNIFFLIVMSVIGIFLVKGVNPPFPDVYTWLFAYFPGFKLFRDPSKFYFFICLGYALLIGSTPKLFPKRWQNLWTIAVMLFFGVLALPATLGLMTGTFSSIPNNNEWFREADRVANDPQFSRSFWIPDRHQLGYSSSVHPSTEAYLFVNKRPFATNILGEYELYNYLRSPATPGLFDIAAIKYLYYPFPDERKQTLKEDEKAYYQWFTDWFRQQSWLSDKSANPKMQIFENKNHASHIFTVDALVWVIGGDDTYANLGQLGVTNFEHTGVIHVQEQSQLLEQSLKFPGTSQYRILNKTSDLDLQMSLYPTEKLFNISSRVSKNGDDPSGWWSRTSSDFLSLRAFLLEKYNLPHHDFDLGQGYAISEGSHTLKAQFPKSGSLYLRVLESTQSGIVKVTQSGSEQNIQTLKPENTLRWEKIGTYVANEPLSITTTGGINIINALAILTTDEEQQLAQKAERVRASTQEASLEQLAQMIHSSNTGLENVMESPTQYQVTIQKAPQFVAFSESYDKLWQLEQDTRVVSSSIPLYSLINGFYVDQPGTYTIVYQAQKDVFPGLIISLLTLLIVLGAIVKDMKRSRSSKSTV